MNRSKLLAIFSLAMLVQVSTGCMERPEPAEEWRLVYRNDLDGNAVAGNKDDLIAAVRAGLPIRVGFGGRSSRDTTRSVEHVADVQFLTVLDGSEVFGQISQIIGQAPAREEDGLKIRFRSHNKWTMIAGTNGYFTGMMVDFVTDSVNTPSERKNGASWFVYGKPKTQKKQKALYNLP